MEGRGLSQIYISFLFLEKLQMNIQTFCKYLEESNKQQSAWVCWNYLIPHNERLKLVDKRKGADVLHLHFKKLLNAVSQDSPINKLGNIKQLLNVSCMEYSCKTGWIR